MTISDVNPMTLYIDDTTEIDAEMIDAGASYYKVRHKETILRVPLHLVQKIRRRPNGDHRIEVSSWYLRRMGVIPREVIPIERT